LQVWTRKVIQQTRRQQNKCGGSQKQLYKKQEEHDPEEYITLGDNNRFRNELKCQTSNRNG